MKKKIDFAVFAVLTTVSLLTFGLAALCMLDLRGCFRVGGEFLLLPLPWVIYLLTKKKGKKHHD
jgi:hypothetical protein